MTLRPTVALAAVLALVGCGESREEKRVKEMRSACESAAGMTVRQLEDTYGTGIRIALCGDETTDPRVTSMGCTSEPPWCVMGFVFAASTDPAVCEPEGCYFTCEVRAQRADLVAHDQDRAATVCGTRWVDGQPYPPFYGAPLWQPGMLEP